MVLSGQNPSVHSRRSVIRSGRNGLSERESLVELRRIEDGRDALSVDVIGTIALDRIRHEVRGELDHAGPRVLASLLIETDGEPLHGLEQCRQEETHGSCADDVHAAAGRQGLQSCGIGCRGHSPPSLVPQSRRRSEMSRTTPASNAARLSSCLHANQRDGFDLVKVGDLDRAASTPAWLIRVFNSGIAKKAFAASSESKVWVTVTSLGFSIERKTWWACTPCSAWKGVKASYIVFQASKSATRWRTRAIVLIMEGPLPGRVPCCERTGFRRSAQPRRRSPLYSSSRDIPEAGPVRAAYPLARRRADYENSIKTLIVSRSFMAR